MVGKWRKVTAEGDIMLKNKWNRNRKVEMLWKREWYQIAICWRLASGRRLTMHESCAQIRASCPSQSYMNCPLGTDKRSLSAPSALAAAPEGQRLRMNMFALQRHTQRPKGLMPAWNKVAPMVWVKKGTGTIFRANLERKPRQRDDYWNRQNRNTAWPP